MATIAGNNDDSRVTSQQENFPCQTCGKPCTLQCGKCKLIRFCNRQCQESLWKSHKALCKKISEAVSSPICLVIDGLGPCSPGGDDVTKLTPRLKDAGLTVVVVDASKGTRIPDQIATLLDRSFPQALIMVGWGSGGPPVDVEFAKCPKFQESLVSWVHQGGRFLVQGEPVGEIRVWPSWFEKPWTNDSYVRTDHVCLAAKQGDPHWCDWYRNAPGAVINKYNVKAVLLGNVDPSEALFASTKESATHSLVPFMAGKPVGQGKAAVAFAKYGDGTISYFGDVNHEDSTLDIMSVIARGY